MALAAFGGGISGRDHELHNKDRRVPVGGLPGHASRASLLGLEPPLSPRVRRWGYAATPPSLARSSRRPSMSRSPLRWGGEHLRRFRQILREIAEVTRGNDGTSLTSRPQGAVSSPRSRFCVYIPHGRQGE